jgi:hypothetical protein
MIWPSRLAGSQPVRRNSRFTKRPSPVVPDSSVDHTTLAALAHHLFKVAVADPELAIPAYAQQNQVCWKAAAFEIGHGGDLGEAPLISLHAANECNRALANP